MAKKDEVTARPGTVAEVIQRGILAGHSPERILRDVGRKFPKSKAGNKDVSYYKWLLKLPTTGRRAALGRGRGR